MIALIILLTEMTFAQTIVAVSKVSNDFYGYDITTNEYLDFRLNQNPSSMDEYLCITKTNDDSAYVGMIKFLDNGDKKPMIIKFNFQDLSYEEIITEEIENPICIDIDPLNNKIYWIDKDLNQMRRSNFDGSEVEMFGEVEEVTNFFLTNSDQYAPAELSSVFQEQPTMWHNGGRIGDLVIPENGEYLFWSNNTNETHPHIIRRELAFGSGGTEEKIIEIEDGAINELAVLNDRMYWSGGFSQISSADFNGDLIEEYIIDRILFDFIVIESNVLSNKAIGKSFPLEIGPNPTENYLKLHQINANEEYYYYITDANGSKVVNITKLFDPTIDINHFSKGVYVLNLINKKGEIASKIFIK